MYSNNGESDHIEKKLARKRVSPDRLPSKKHTYVTRLHEKGKKKKNYFCLYTLSPLSLIHVYKRIRSAAIGGGGLRYAVESDVKNVVTHPIHRACVYSWISSRWWAFRSNKRRQADHKSLKETKKKKGDVERNDVKDSRRCDYILIWSMCFSPSAGQRRRWLSWHGTLVIVVEQ